METKNHDSIIEQKQLPIYFAARKIKIYHAATHTHVRLDIQIAHQLFLLKVAAIFVLFFSPNICSHLDCDCNGAC